MRDFHANCILFHSNYNTTQNQRNSTFTPVGTNRGARISPLDMSISTRISTPRYDEVQVERMLGRVLDRLTQLIEESQGAWPANREECLGAIPRESYREFVDADYQEAVRRVMNQLFDDLPSL